MTTSPDDVGRPDDAHDSDSAPAVRLRGIELG